MARQVPVASMMNTFKFGKAKWCFVLYVPRSSGIMCALVGLVFSKAKFVIAHPHGQIPLQSLLFPIFKPFFSFDLVRFDKKFKLHLLKFSAAKRKVTRSNLVSEGLTDLGDTKRDL